MEIVFEGMCEKKARNLLRQKGIENATGLWYCREFNLKRKQFDTIAVIDEDKASAETLKIARTCGGYVI